MTEATPEQFADGRLHFTGGSLRADRVVALPRLYGPAIPGLPQRPGGLSSRRTPSGRIDGVEQVYGAGDGTAFRLKQGGMAAHQADAAAQAIALAAGAPVDPTPLRPVLRAVLLTGVASPSTCAAACGPHGSRRRPRGDRGHPFWWPPDKIAGRYLAPFLSRAEPLAPAASALPASA